jgi:hypothetical protein
VSLVRNANIWELACGLFARRAPVCQRDLSAAQQAQLPALGSGITRSTASDLRSVLCPFCYQHQGPVEAITEYPVTLACRCPACGLVPLEGDHATRISVDPMWLGRQQRGAMSIQSHDQPQQLSTDIWRIGEVKSEPVVLARNVHVLVNEPNLIDRLRTKASHAVSIIAPRSYAPEALTARLGLNWLRLEERFTWYGSRVTFDVPPKLSLDVSPAAPTKTQGPFSEDFRVVHLDAWPHGPIVLSDAQAAVFRVLHHAGRELSAEEVMRKAGLASEKPGDVFKVKTKNKGDARFEGPLVAFRALISVNQRLGAYLLVDYQYQGAKN